MKPQLHSTFRKCQTTTILWRVVLFCAILFSNQLSNAQCASNATSTADEEILNVTFGTLNNSSSCSSTGGTGSILNEYSNYAYAGFPGGVPTVNIGCSVSFSIQIGTCGGNYSNAIAIYIDWNNDGDFVDAGEKVYNSASSTSGPHTETGSITVPAGATVGNCKMRVVNVETSTPTSINPCGTYSWGETEDYFINVSNGGAVAPYISSNVTQLVNSMVSQCAYYQQIICVPVVMGSGCSAGNLTQFQLGPGSSTNLPADVSKIHIFYTGSTNTYLATNEFVSGGTVPTGVNNTINGSQALIPNATNYFWIVYDINNASTIGNLIDGSCNQITIGGTNQVPTTTNPAGSGTITNCPCGFSLGSDLTLCAPFTYTLNGPAGFDTYTWTPGGATTQNLTVNSAGTYTCSATLINGGLVTNGDFSSGNTGFTTSYVPGTGGAFGLLTNPGTYAVTTNPNAVHNNFYSFGDHTTGTGNMMVCNGSDIANTVVWSQTITVTPNTNYNFSAWVASVENTTNEAQLQFSINGNLIGPVVSAPLTGGVWLNFFVNWNSGSSSSAVIKIVDQSTEPSGNDFAIDDITFERVCTFSDIITINSGSTATVSVPSNFTACNNNAVAASSFTSSTAGVTYTWTNSNTLTGLPASGSGNTPTFTASNNSGSPVTSVISVTPSVGGCVGTPKSYTITVNPTPTLSVNSPTTCSGVVTQITANGASSYTWNTGPTTPTINVSPASQTVYTVTGNSGGCQANATATVFISPALAVTVNSPTICSGTSTVLTASGASNYTWSTGATTSTISISPTSTTSYSVVGNTSGCTGSGSTTVSVNNPPTVTINSATLCSGASTVLTASGATSYSWNTGATTSTINASPSSTSIYTVTGATNGCSANNTGTIVVNPTPTVTINSATLCAGSTTVLSATGAASYTWNTGATTQTISASPGSTTVYTVTGVTSGCSSLNTGTIVINSNPTLTVNSPTTCSGVATTLSASGATSYTWSTGATSQSISVAPTSNTIYTVTGTSLGCLGTTSSTVSINSALTVSINSPTICSGTSTVLTAVGATNYTWSTGATTSTISISPSSTSVYSVTGESSGCLGTGNTTVNVNSNPVISINNATLCAGASTVLTASGASSYTWNTGATTTTINVSPSSSITYSVVGSNSGCIGTSTAIVTVNSSPAISVTGSTLCAGSSTILTASGANSYTWSTGATTSTISVSPLTTSTYSVAGDIAGCVGSNTLMVTVNAIPTLTVNNPTICSGASVQLAAIPSLTGGSYTWTPGGQTTQTITVSPGSSANYSVTYSVNGCSVTAASNVSVSPAPTVTITSVSICEGATATITATPSVPGGTYIWSPNGQNTASITDSPSSTTNYSVLYSLNGCTTTATGNINVTPIPMLTLSSSSNSINPLENVTINSNGTTGTLIWSTGESTSSITVNPQQTTTYCATLTTTSGCTNRNCLTIFVMDISTLYIPNVFTPNNDGVNDIFFTPGSNITEYQLDIFNRWGQLLFSSDQVLKGWDGTFKGQVVPDGVYVYILKAKGADNVIYNYTGHITVFK